MSSKNSNFYRMVVSLYKQLIKAEFSADDFDVYQNAVIHYYAEKQAENLLKRRAGIAKDVLFPNKNPEDVLEYMYNYAIGYSWPSKEWPCSKTELWEMVISKTAEEQLEKIIPPIQIELVLNKTVKIITDYLKSVSGFPTAKNSTMVAPLMSDVQLFAQTCTEAFFYCLFLKDKASQKC